MPPKPKAAASRNVSSGKIFSASQRAASGSMRAVANCRAVSRNACWSAESSKSMRARSYRGVPLCQRSGPMTMFGARLAGALRLLCLVAAKENQVRPNLTHFALHVANIDATSAFYERFAGMRTVRSWADQDGSSLKVKWLKSAEASNPFVLVLLEGTSETFGGGHQGLIGPLSHFGFAVDSRAEVDDVANNAQAA